MHPPHPQSITALAHLRAAVMYLVDISEQCGYSLAQQAALFHSIKPLFANKPVIIVVNKIDARPFDDLRPDERALLDEMVAEARKISNGGGWALGFGRGALGCWVGGVGRVWREDGGVGARGAADGGGAVGVCAGVGLRLQ